MLVGFHTEAFQGNEAFVLVLIVDLLILKVLREVFTFCLGKPLSECTA